MLPESGSFCAIMPRSGAPSREGDPVPGASAFAHRQATYTGMRACNEGDDMNERGARSRNPRIEALRLIAILGIAVFHIFQPWFDALTNGSWSPSPALGTALGSVSLLGAYGNDVFFLISGYFLVPRAGRRARSGGYWPSQATAAFRRALPILATVAVYAVVALLVSAYIAPMPGVSIHETGWLVGGLEFIWVYLAVMVLTPAIGWLWSRLERPSALVGVLVIVTAAINAYIAFISPGEDVRSLLEWRKLMSAASYLVAFLAGGALAESDWARHTIARLLGPLVAAALAIEAAAAFSGNLWLLKALSFKSTSALSFALAASSLALAVREPGQAWPKALSSLLCALARSVLAFYVAQSMFAPLWRPIAADLCAAALASGEAAFLAMGIASSVLLLASILVFDQLVRLPLLRLARLA